MNIKKEIQQKRKTLSPSDFIDFVFGLGYDEGFSGSSVGRPDFESFLSEKEMETFYLGELEGFCES